MPHIIVRGAVPPPGANVAWTATRVESTLVPGPGWVYEAPTFNELMAYAGNQARGFVARASQGPWDPASLPQSVRGTDWAALQDAANNPVATAVQLKTALLAAEVAAAVAVAIAD